MYIIFPRQSIRLKGTRTQAHTFTVQVRYESK